MNYPLNNNAIRKLIVGRDLLQLLPTWFDAMAYFLLVVNVDFTIGLGIKVRRTFDNAPAARGENAQVHDSSAQ